MPPGFSMEIACFTISFCIFAHSGGFSSLQTRAASGFLRNMPSPEHGASTRILSKYAGNCSAIFAGTSFKRKEFGIPITSMFFRSAFTLEALMSFATRSPSPNSFAPSSVALPPGAAQRSSTRSPGPTGSLEAVVIALGS